MRRRLLTLLSLGLATAGLAMPSAASAAPLGVPFDCDPVFYQVTATNSGSFQKYDVATNSFSRLGAMAASGINGIGYNTDDDYVYGVAGSSLWRIDSTGSYTNTGTVTGVGSVGGGDYYDHRLVVAPTSGNAWSAIDTTTRAVTPFGLTAAANGHAASATWGAYDLTVQGDVAYGLDGTTLYIVTMDTRQVSKRTVTGVSTGNYGAAYSDEAGNAFFYNNTDNKVYMFSPEELANATGSATAPKAKLVGLGASTPKLTAPNDGASCPDAVSPYAPTVDDSATASSGVTETTATLGGRATANNLPTTVGFCYGTDPALVGCATAVGTPGSIAGAEATSFTASLTGLTPGTTYYYQVVATNEISPNTGAVKSFTTVAAAEAEPQAQSIDFPVLEDGRWDTTSVTLGATSTSGLPVSYTVDTPGTCSVTGGVLTGLRSGTCTVTATQPGDEEWAAAEPVTRSAELAHKPQTITFGALDGITFGDDAPAAVADASSALPVTLSSLTPQVCSVDDGAVSVAAVGTCTVEATQPGNHLWAAATPVQRSFDVAAKGQSIDLVVATRLPVLWNSTARATATSGLPVTLTTSTPAVCEVRGLMVVGLAAGTCTVTATQDGDATHAAAAPVTRSFPVEKQTQTITMTPVDDVKVTSGPVSTTATSNRDATPSYDSLTPAVCTVAQDGTVNLVAAGTCEVRGFHDGDELLEPASETVEFKVLPAFEVEVPAPAAAVPGAPVTLTVPASGGVGPYTWSVADVEGNVLPAGLVLDTETGEITGTPTRTGAWTVKVTVTDADGESVVRTVHLTVARDHDLVAPSGRRTVAAGETFWLPENPATGQSWSFDPATGIKRLGLEDGKRWFRATSAISGNNTLTLRVSEYGDEALGAFVVTVLPPEVKQGSYRLTEGLTGQIRWTPRATPGVVGYRVYVDGTLVGRTTDPTAGIDVPVGPRSVVTVRAEGHDGVLSAAVRLRYTAPKKVTRASTATTVYFATESAQLGRAARKELGHLVKVVRKLGLKRVEADGFTDDRGSVRYNLALSERRADAVRRYLVARLHGVKVTTDAHSEHRPVADNRTDKGMSQNRRTEIRAW